MALKVYKDEKFKTIATRSAPPVCFIGGEKKKLVKGVVFVNGEKKTLWDVSRRISIDTFQMPYENSSPTSAGCLWVSSAKLWAIYTTGRYGLRSYDLGETATLQEGYDFGWAVVVSPGESASSNVFYLTSYTSTKQSSGYLFNATVRRCVITSSGAATISESYILYNTVATRYPPFTVNIGAKFESGWASIGGTNYQTSVPEFRINGEKIYTFGSAVTMMNTLVRNSTNSMVGRKSLSEFESSITYFGNTATREASQTTGGNLNDILYDVVKGRYIISTGSTDDTLGGIEYRHASTWGLLHSIQSTQDNRRVYKIVGKIGEYYYVLNLPFDANSSDQQGYLEAYDVDGNRYHQVVELPEIPDVDSFYNAKWTTARMIPTISYTGYLGFFVDKYLVRIFGV